MVPTSTTSTTTHLLEAVLQDLEGLGQVPRLAPGPGREERTAGGQGQRHERQGDPDDAELSHSPPLQDSVHVALGWVGGEGGRRVYLPCMADRSECPMQLHPSKALSPTRYQKPTKITQIRSWSNVHFGAATPLSE